ncbi:hypothetical protein I3842_12G004500 [Carya illinoinensis]|uniref:Leucine-rich repeat-containing N-terminal plant-type domain-containing protein n=1 Tax=Carya illinoinensis TaxID=32201 RepID=A0A922IVB3_CARIL|nr:hypothetical protein I3842_12G004500 [Carya illinoinensis]
MSYPTIIMADLKPHYLLFTLMFIFKVFAANHACNQLDGNSLSSLLLDSSNSTPFNWSSINCCHWEGISCDHKGRVTHLWLPSKGLKGSISPSLGNLTRLSHLNLSHNSLTGLLPTQLFSLLNQLRVLDLRHNHLAGQLPSGIGGCSKLKIFWAGFNSFFGFLPHDIYYAAALKEISLPSNNLSGSISNNIMNLSKLTSLELYQNQLSGNLPLNIGKLSKLKHLILHTNSFMGSFSHSLLNCTNLIHLSLRMNFFDENITDLNISNLHCLTILDLGSNNFIGKFLASIHSCVSLRAIRIARNQLEGQIPPDLAQLKYLSFLSAGSNKLTNVTAAIKILMRCSILEVVMLGNNFLRESMPTDVSMIDTDGFKNLRVLFLSFCQLTGQFPIWISKLKNLQFLSLSSNRITSSIPGWLSTLPRLSTIDLSYNLFSGEFPKKFCELQAFVSVHAIDYNSSLTIPIYFTTEDNNSFNSFNYFSRLIFLRNNSLSGTIPIEIGCLKRLRGLDLSHNKLIGTIPTQISELTDLEYLDLSANHLYGEIPVSLINLHFLRLFSVANNNLNGAIPVGTQLQAFNASSFEGNQGLCGYPLPQCSLTSNKRDEDIQEGEDRRTIPWFHVIVVLGFITGFWGVCAPFVFCYFNSSIH